MRFGPAFACSPIARAQLLMSAIVSCGTGSFLASFFDLFEKLKLDAQVTAGIRIFCIVSFVLALLVSVTGFLSILVNGIGHCGEVTVRGRRIRENAVGLVFLGVFALPWLTLIALRLASAYL